LKSYGSKKGLLVLGPSEWEWYDTNLCLSELYFRFYLKLCQSDTKVIQKHILVTYCHVNGGGVQVNLSMFLMKPKVQ